jgi:hypothetical protein
VLDEYKKLQNDIYGSSIDCSLLREIVSILFNFKNMLRSALHKPTGEIHVIEIESVNLEDYIIIPNA